MTCNACGHVREGTIDVIISTCSECLLHNRQFCRSTSNKSYLNTSGIGCATVKKAVSVNVVSQN